MALDLAVYLKSERIVKSETKFKVGDKVHVYLNRAGLPQRMAAIVTEITKYGILVKEEGNRNSHYEVHPKQCRKPKPEEKSVKVSYSKFAKAWDSFFQGTFSAVDSSIDSPLTIFNKLCIALGLERPSK